MIMTKEEEQKAAEAIKVDSYLYQYLTEEMLAIYAPIIFDIGRLEGDFIGQFEKKANDKGITVKEEYINQLWEDKKPIPGVDLRSGEYGIEYAGAGFFRAGCQYFDRNDMENALINLEKAIELCPRNILARLLKMKVHQKEGNFYLAAAEAGNCIALNPVSIAEKDNSSGAVLKKFSEGFTDELKEILVFAYYTRGSYLYTLGELEGALPDFSETIRRMPALTVAVDARLGIYVEMERWEEALADADTLLAAGYELEKTHQNRGVILKMQERYLEATQEFTAAIAINPDLTWAYLQRSDCNFEEGFMEAAADDAGEAVKRNVPYAHYYRAKAYLCSGEYTKAIEDFDAALVDDIDNEEIKGWRDRAVENKKTGMVTHYYRQNKNGEWEQVGKRDGEIISVIPSPDYQNFLDEFRKEEAEERLIASM